MSDFDQRLTESLTRAAQEAPSVSGLADGARSRARARRRSRVGAIAVAVALCIGVPTAVVAARDPGARGAPSGPAEAASTPPDLPPGLRVESWHNVTIEVPDDWGYGALSQYCGPGAPQGPLVERAADVSSLVLCDPASTYGVTLAPAGGHDTEWPVYPQHSQAWPDGAFVGATTVGDVVVTVAAPELLEAQAVLSSAREIGPEGDPYGCSSSRGEAPPVDVPEGAMRICRYDADGLLEQSELLTGGDVVNAVAALESAPEIPSGEGCPRNVTDVEPVVRMHSSEAHANVDLAGDCPIVHGLGPDRELTPDVLYWALSPGWSGDSTNLPLPPELRQQ